MTESLPDERLRGIAAVREPISADDIPAMAREILDLRSEVRDLGTGNAALRERMGELDRALLEAQARAGEADKLLGLTAPSSELSDQQFEVVRERVAGVHSTAAWLIAEARWERDREERILESALLGTIEERDEARAELDRRMEEPVTLLREVRRAREPFGTPTIRRDDDGDWIVTFPGDGSPVCFGCKIDPKQLRLWWRHGIAAKAVLDHLEQNPPSLRDDIAALITSAFNTEYSDSPNRAAAERVQKALDAGVFVGIKDSDNTIRSDGHGLAAAKPSLRDDIATFVEESGKRSPARTGIDDDVWRRVKTALGNGVFDWIEASE